MLLKVPGARWIAQRAFRWQRGMTLGVRAVLIDDQNRLLLVRHGYAHGWHFPGGGVERGESLLIALTREVREEAGATLTAPPHLHGIFTNFDAFPGDHIALFVCRAFDRPIAPKPSFEIREQGFFSIDHLPDATTQGTRARIAEVFGGAAAADAW